MSIDTELARLTNAKSAIQAAIEGKGVTVPDGTLLDSMASLIEGIEAGAGSKVYIEQRTFASNATSVTITHNLGEIPTIVAQLMMTCNSGKYTQKARIGIGYYKDDSWHGTTAYNGTASNTFNFQDSPPIKSTYSSNISDTTCKLTPNGGNSAGSYYYASDTYLFLFISGVVL